MGDNPKIAAERLLRSVLPEDLCVSLSAIGECEVQGKKYRYKLFKNKKTHCIQGDKIFSCCIELSDSEAPDTDRIVAEYLLIRNDEARYLSTANLTQIVGPRPDVRTGVALRFDAIVGNGYDHRIDALRYAIRPPFIPLEGNPGGRVGDAIQVRRPPQYDAITGRMIVTGLLHEMRERLPGMRWPALSEEDLLHSPMLQRRVVHVDVDLREPDLTLPYDDFRVRVIQPAAWELARAIAEPPNLLAFWDLPLEGSGAARATDNETNLKAGMHRAYEIRYNRMATRFACGLILRA